MLHVWVLLLVLAMNGGHDPNYGLVAFYGSAEECSQHIDEVTKYGSELDGTKAGTAVCMEFDMLDQSNAPNI